MIDFMAFSLRQSSDAISLVVDASELLMQRFLIASLIFLILVTVAT
jgi:hypothetical protein